MKIVIGKLCWGLGLQNSVIINMLGLLGIRFWRGSNDLGPIRSAYRKSQVSAIEPPELNPKPKAQLTVMLGLCLGVS